MPIARPFFIAAALCFTAGAHAAILRPYSEISRQTISLADLFDQLGQTPDRVLGRGPAPGARIAVGAAQLAAIARDFGVDWRPTTGSERCVIEQQADTVPQSAIENAVRQALVEKGAPQISDLNMPDAQPFLVPMHASPSPKVSQTSYDTATGRFTTMVSVSVPDGSALQQRVSGIVIPMEFTVVTTHQLSQGEPVTADDIEVERVRRQRLRGAKPLGKNAVLGLNVRHSLAAGQPLLLADLSRPDLVSRGTVVRMQLSAGGITLTGQGVARDAGAMGDHIHVENPASHVLIEAEVTGEGEVRVDADRMPVASVKTR